MKYSLIETNNRYIDTFKRYSLLLNDHSSIEIYKEPKEYRLQVTLGCIFRAKDSTYDQAVAHAHKKLSRHIFGDILNKVNDIQSATFGGDSELVLKLCQEAYDIVNKFEYEMIKEY